MVSRFARKQIVRSTLLLVVVLMLVVVVLVNTASKSLEPVFVASDNGLDLTVLNGIVAAQNDTQFVSSVKAVVVPHHLVATKAIARGVKSVAASSPKIVVIISPDHFFRCPKFMCTTTGRFETFFGDIFIDQNSVRKLDESPQVEISRLFEKEHGILAVVPYVKHYIPDAKIVPIVLSQKTIGSEKSREDILATLEPLISRDDVAIIISSDFSHYLPIAETREKDKETQASFCAGNSNEIIHLENPSQSDCPLCLWLLVQQAKKSGFWNPVVLSHTNSAELLQDESAQELTSHFTFALSRNTVPPGSCQFASEKQHTTMLFVGDMSFDRYIRQTIHKRGSDHVFSCIDPLLTSVDFVVGNLEGPITEHASVSEGSEIGSPENYRFTFPTTTANILLDHNIRIVNIGNNHINDFGVEGITSTRSALSGAGVSYFGGLAENTSHLRLFKNGTKFSFINFNEFGGESADDVARLIAREREAGRRVVVFTHWGEEYVGATARMRKVAKLFADSGAEIVIGSHPHVIQEHEMIGSTPVYYSLGNFIFDQYFNAEVRHGLALKVTFDKDRIETEEIRTIMYPDGRTCVIGGAS